MSAQQQMISPLMSKFRGCLLGGLVGDCLGSPFEDRPTVSNDALKKFLAKQMEEQSEKLPTFQILPYTDDSSMSRCTAQSLVEMKKFDPKDMAKRFTLEYNKEPNRGYGGHVVNVFAGLMLANYEHPYEPANRQFGGLGSYGNGGAMRTGPVALYGYNMKETELVELTRDCARITHANWLGYNGAILQCLAVHQALHIATHYHSSPNSSKNNSRPPSSNSNSSGGQQQQLHPNSRPRGSLSAAPLDYVAFLNGLIEKMARIEAASEKPAELAGDPAAATPFTDRLRKVKEILVNEVARGVVYPVEKIVAALGNDVSALKSVPTAIYAALRGTQPLLPMMMTPTAEHQSGGSFESSSPFLRTLYTAISLGGDTDTIASMACSISGALYGLEAIPRILVRHCEGNELMTTLADDLYRIVRASLVVQSSAA